MTTQTMATAQPREESQTWVSSGYLLLGTMVMAFISHAYNMFRYPIYLGDEGIYMEQAWAVLREGRLAPYTYTYDHAPAGWLMIAGWVLLLPHQFLAFGMAINSGRFLMLILHVASAAMLFKIAQKFSGSDKIAVLVAVIFSLSPLALFYQRMVLLDNIMVFWFLVSLYLILYHGQRLMVMLAAGTAFGIAVLSKENAILFAPVLAYIIWLEVKESHHRRFATAGFAFTGGAVISFYVMYAFLKGELFPPGNIPILMSPDQHESLIGAIMWQLGRSGGGITDPNSDFWVFMTTRWWTRDSFIIVAGTVSMAISLWLGIMDRRKYRPYFLGGLLALPFAFYVTRGSALLEFYVTPAIPFYALTIGLIYQGIDRALPHGIRDLVFVAGVAVLVIDYIWVARDPYALDNTQLQYRQLQFIRQNIPGDAVMVVDDDLWVDLHEANRGQPVYLYAQSYSKVQADPAIRDTLLNRDWSKVDYLVMSNKLHDNLLKLGYDFVLQIYDHSHPIAKFVQGDVEVEVRQIDK